MAKSKKYRKKCPAGGKKIRVAGRKYWVHGKAVRSGKRRKKVFKVFASRCK